MSDSKGTFIVIEGTDGSGKATQFELLTTELIKAGHEVVIFDFPQYEEPSSYFVRQYLNGAYGSVEDVGPYTGSLFYALDRYEAAPKIRAALEEGKVVVANRFVGSSMAHQGGKFRHAEERRGYFIWLDNLEFEMLSIPRPTISLVLRVTAEVSQEMVDQKAARSYTDKKRDIHEASLEHLQHALEVYDDMCQLFPKDFVRVDCVRDEKLLDIPTVAEIVWQKVQPYLPEPSRRSSSTLPNVNREVIAENPYIHRNDQGIFEVTAAGREFLQESVTNAEGDVYAFTGKLAPSIIAAAIVQRTKRVDDLRLTLLQDLAGKREDEQVKQMQGIQSEALNKLAGIHVVVENASNFLTKNLDWGKLATYLELAGPYSYLDKRDSKGKYSYYTPPELDLETKKEYRQYMDQLFDAYSEVVNKLTSYIGETSVVPVAKRNDSWKAKVRAEACEAASSVLPVATTTTVGIFASVHSLESLIVHLLGDVMPEVRAVGQKMLIEARKVVPNFLNKKNDISISYVASTRQSIKDLSEKYVSSQHSSTDDLAKVRMDSVYPRNEFELLPDMLYEVSGVSLQELTVQITSWPYEQKLEAFNSYLGDRNNKYDIPGRALEKVQYSWDIISDYSTFRSVHRNGIINDLEWQTLTPRFGFDMPEIIEDAGLEDLYENSFEISLKLYSLLQERGYDADAQYVTLLGHKLRWKMIINGRDAFQLLEDTDHLANKSYRKLIMMMHQKLSEVHPILGSTIKFTEE
jgi:thymidylate kinase